MTSRKSLRPRTPRSLQFLRQAARAAEDWPVAGSAVRRFQEAESWALTELKQRLDSMSDSFPAGINASDIEAAKPRPPVDMMARLLGESQGVDPDAAQTQLYRQTLSRMLPDQAAMLALLAAKGNAPLCHVAAGRLPAGPVNLVVLANATSLGRDAGVLLRDFVPHYVSGMLAMGVFEAGPEDEALADQYELLMADTQIRTTMTRIRSDMKMYPRLQRFSMHLSDFGKALWQDCRPPELFHDTVAARQPPPTQGE